MNAQQSEDLLRRLNEAYECVARLSASVAMLQGIDIGQRVVFEFGGGERPGDVRTLHGYVVGLERRPADAVLGAWMRVIGHQSWMHFEPLPHIVPVCGVCGDCIRLAQHPECIERTRRRWRP